ESKLKRLTRLLAEVEPLQDIWFIDLEKFERRNGIALRAAHLGTCTLNANKLVLHKLWRIVVKNLSGYHLPLIVTTPWRGVVMSAWFKEHPFVTPAHGPVNLPLEFGNMLLREIDCFFLTGINTAISDLCAPIVGKNLRRIGTGKA